MHARAFHGGTIRPLRPTDVTQATEILLQSPQAAFWSPAGLQELLAQSDVVGFACEADLSMQGFIVARYIAGEGEILNLAVAPQWRRTSHGSALLAAILGEFQYRRVTRVFLEVRDSNTAAAAFYGKHGFAPIARRKSYYRDPEEDAVVMEKKLTA